MGVKRLVKQVLSQKENLRYKIFLAKSKVGYSLWLERQERVWQEENEQIMPGKAEDGGFVFLCASKGILTSYARKSILCYFKAHPEVQILYGDEDVRGTGKACCPVFRPGWSPDVLDGCFYLGSIVAMRKEFFDKAIEETGQGPLLQTMKANDFMAVDFPAYARWMNRCVELAGGYERGSRSIGHVARILFHCQSREELLKFGEELPFHREHRNECYDAFRKSIRARGRDTAIPLVTVVVPSKDHPEMLGKCLRSLKAVAEGLALEVIVVDNGSTEENREEAGKVLDGLREETFQVSCLYRPMVFHFSRMCNLGAEAARGRFLLFLNDDVELAVQGCVEQMAALAARPYTGAVGMKLYYPGSEKIQHAGITNLPMGPVHKLQFMGNGEAYGDAYQGNANYLAVTAACLMAEREKFREAGGFAEELQVAFNDVDLCFALYEAGYRNVCMNGCYAYHHESLSRGDDETVEKLERLLEEREKLYERHPDMEGEDPYYSVHLSREGLDTKIRPAYETAGNVVQEYDKFLAEKTLYDYRRDQCVMVRVEAVRRGEIFGWVVVLGDNNACYAKELMLKRVTESFSPDADEWFRGPNGIFAIPLRPQYRPDLEENMPDQSHVALSGFHVRLKANLLPPGRYRIGAAVKHRITGAGLMNWSNRFIEIL